MIFARRAERQFDAAEDPRQHARAALGPGCALALDKSVARAELGLVDDHERQIPFLSRTLTEVDNLLQALLATYAAMDDVRQLGDGVVVLERAEKHALSIVGEAGPTVEQRVETSRGGDA